MSIGPARESKFSVACFLTRSRCSGRLQASENPLTLGISVVGPILLDLCVQCASKLAAGDQLLLPLSCYKLDSQTKFAQLQECRKVVCHHEGQTGARRGDCCLALGKPASISTYLYIYIYVCVYTHEKVGNESQPPNNCFVVKGTRRHTFGCFLYTRAAASITSRAGFVVRPPCL